tara:strand:- start:44 stop:589 length:546 start_codon:yes stop_codon:yes gene_type:complete
MAVTFHPDGRTIVNGINRTPSLMVDSWRLTSGTGSAYNGDVGGGGNASSWARWNAGGFGQIGTGLTNSSGIFSFPSTGIYFITGSFRLTCDNGDFDANVDLRTTTDNGSSYYRVALASVGNGASNNGNTSHTPSVQFIFDVTSTTTHKFKWTTIAFEGNSNMQGSSSMGLSSFQVFRLGDT